MNIYTTFKSEPFFQISVTLSNKNVLYLKWNIFRDKKNNNNPVMRVRYTLLDENGKRKSLKTLNLKEPVTFKEIAITEELEEFLENIASFEDLEKILGNMKNFDNRELLIAALFGSWLNTEFPAIINSGDYKIVQMISLELK